MCQAIETIFIEEEFGDGFSGTERLDAPSQVDLRT